RLDDVADPQAGGGDDVALLAVQVVQQGQAGGTVGVVLDRRHLGRHAVLGAAEVHRGGALLVAAAPVAGGGAGMRPWTLRPPFLGLGASSAFSGVCLVTSAKSATELPRRPGVVGLCLRMPMATWPRRSRSCRRGGGGPARAWSPCGPRGCAGFACACPCGAGCSRSPPARRRWPGWPP